MHLSHISAQVKRPRRDLPAMSRIRPVNSGSDLGGDTPTIGRSKTSSFLRKITRGTSLFVKAPQRHADIPEEEESLPRFVPVPPSKYTAVWQRVRSKLKTRAMISDLRANINLFGSGAVSALEPSQHALEAKLRAQLHPHQRDADTQWLFMPESRFKSVWDVMNGLAVMHIALFLPYTLAFEDAKEWTYMDYGLDVFFLAELLITCNSAYYDADYQLVTQRSKIMTRYLTTWFFPDLLSCLPFDLVLDSESDQHSMLRLIKLYRFIRLTKVLKALRNSSHSVRVMQIQDFLHLSFGGYRLAVTLVGMFIVIHFVACLWVFTARLDNFDPQTWVVRNNLSANDKTTLYIASFYWAVTSFTTVGYGDIYAQTDTERFIAVIWMLAGVYFFSFLLSTLTNLISSSDTKEHILAHRTAIIDEFSQDSKIKPELKARLLAAVHFSTEKSAFSWYDKSELLNELPKELRYEVALAMHGGAAKHISFFQDKDPAFLAAILPFVRDELVRTGEIICKEDEYAGEIYFLTKGSVQFVEGEHRRVYRVLHQGAYFGDVEVLQGIPRKYTIVAVCDCHLLTLSRKFLGLVQRDFPLIWKEMNEVAEQRDCINMNALREFRTLLNLKAEGQLKFLTTDQVRSIVAAPLQTQAEPTLADLDADISSLESGLSALESDMTVTNELLDSAIALVRSRRGLKTTARLLPLESKDAVAPCVETPCKSTVPTELGRDGDESGHFG